MSENIAEPEIKSMRYLGNKTPLLQDLNKIIDDLEFENNNITIFDGFGGTGSVAQYFNHKNYNVLSNDINKYSYYLCYSRNCITIDDLKFETLNMNIEQVLSHLNKCKKKGFIYSNYSPNTESDIKRKYFTCENAEIIDGIRTQIEEWFISDMISKEEYIHLIALLTETTSLYSNIPGTYGAFLNKWDSRALKKLELTTRISKNLLSKRKNNVFNEDINTIIKDIKCDVLYIDPPYNERDYSMYYHVLETIAKYDNPELKENKTGTKKTYIKSKWCSKKTCKQELEHICKNTKAKYIIMSYNNEGILTLETIKEILSKFGSYTQQKKLVKRFKCRKEQKEKEVFEYFHILKLNPITKIQKKKFVVKNIYNKIYNSCCLKGMKMIDNKKIDLICTDLPYGLTECKWDSIIDLDLMWTEYKRILKENGTIILFGQQPFSSKLVSSNYEMFKYSLVWNKSKPGGFAQAPYKVLCEHEYILIFTYGKTTQNSKNRMTYNPQDTKSCNIKMKGKTGETAHRKGRKTQSDYVQTTTNYPRSILKFNNEGKVKHPTQKPLELIEYLIKTFSNENEIVLDSCMGSGTTAIACLKTNRKFIGYEKETEYFDICNKRIDDLKKEQTN